MWSSVAQAEGKGWNHMSLKNIFFELAETVLDTNGLEKWVFPP